jgi:hypothetical protein
MKLSMARDQAANAMSRGYAQETKDFPDAEPQWGRADTAHVKQKDELKGTQPYQSKS